MGTVIDIRLSIECIILPNGRSYNMRRDGDVATTVWWRATPENRKIYVDLEWLNEEARDYHRGFLKHFLQCMDHEFSHAFEPSNDGNRQSENRADAFARAGVWARL